MDSNKGRSLGGRVTARLYGGANAAKARDGLLAKYAAEDGIDLASMRPDLLEAYRKQVGRRAIQKAQAAQDLKRAVIRAEREAEEQAHLAAKARARTEAGAQQ